MCIMPDSVKETKIESGVENIIVLEPDFLIKTIQFFKLKLMIAHILEITDDAFVIGGSVFLVYGGRQLLHDKSTEVFAPSVVGQHCLSYSASEYPVKSRLLSVFSIPTRINGGILFSSTNLANVLAMCGKSSFTPPSGIYITG